MRINLSLTRSVFSGIQKKRDYINNPPKREKVTPNRAVVFKRFNYAFKKRLELIAS